MKKVLVIILGAGFAYRLLFLGKRQLWTDELMQALVARESSPEGMLARLQGGIVLPSPLDFLIQKGVVLVLGESPWALRLHAVLLGTLSLWIFFRIAQRLFGRRTALYATVLLALFPLHYHYSQEGRPYALFLFLTLICYELLLRKIMAEGAGWSDWAVLGIALALLLYTSFLGILVMLSQVAGLAASLILGSRITAARTRVILEGEKPDLPSARLSQVAQYCCVAAAACLLFVPWARLAWQAPLAAAGLERLSPRILLRIVKEIGDNSYPMTALLLLGGVTGVRALLRHGRRQALAWLAAWFGVSFPCLFLFELLTEYPFAVHQILHCTPPLILLAGYGLSYAGERFTILDQQPYRASSPALLYAGALLILSLSIARSHWSKELADWRGTAKALEAITRPGDELAMPEVSDLLEYHAPSLANFAAADLDPAPGSLRSADVSRRIVVCYDGMTPDPCSRFRPAAARDRNWTKLEFRGFSVFLRQK
mgnify:CR=1 FL=1